MTTQLNFLADTFQFEITTALTGSGKDEEGFYLVPEATICYPGGGGQEPDKAKITLQDGTVLNILKAMYKNGSLHHYVEIQVPLTGTFGMQIDKDHRMQNARLHTAGHLLSSVVYEHLQLPLLPVKGFHYRQGAYIEFRPDNEKNEFDADIINAALAAAIAKGAAITTQIVPPESDAYRAAFKPEGFLPPADKPLRLVQIEGFLAYPCGGTHLRNTRELEFVRVKSIKHKKGNIRISYEAA